MLTNSLCRYFDCCSDFEYMYTKSNTLCRLSNRQTYQHVLAAIDNLQMIAHIKVIYCHACASFYRFAVCRRDSSLWSPETDARTAYFLFPQNTENDIARGLFIEPRKAKSLSNQKLMFLIMSNDLQSLTSKEIEYRKLFCCGRFKII